jgi:hypothetical protein
MDRLSDLECAVLHLHDYLCCSAKSGGSHWLSVSGWFGWFGATGIGWRNDCWWVAIFLRLWLVADFHCSRSLHSRRTRFENGDLFHRPFAWPRSWSSCWSIPCGRRGMASKSSLHCLSLIHRLVYSQWTGISISHPWFASGGRDPDSSNPCTDESSSGFFGSFR